ncbi:MAG: serine hydrolase domain-containing protein, partial [Bacteroidota bacterium]
MRIFLLILFLGYTLGCLFGQELDRDRLNDILHAVVSEKSKTEEPGGAIVVVHQGETVFQEAYGQSNLTYHFPNSASTLFDAMSLAKQFTGFGICMLVDQGSLRLEDDIRTYLPEVPEFGKTITIYQLLHHTSGIRDFAHLLYLGGYMGEYSKEAVLRMVSRQQALNFVSGEQFTYSNTGYVLLAEIIERITGLDFPTWMNDNIFKPLGMSNSYFRTSPERVYPNLAQGYYRDGLGFRAPINNLTAHGSSALLTTVDDLAKWVDNLRTHVLGNENVHELFLTKGQLDNGEEIAYAAGINNSTFMGLPVLNHTGGGVGFSSIVAYFPGEDLGFIMLSNAGWTNPYDWATDILQPTFDHLGIDYERGGEVEPSDSDVEARVMETDPPDDLSVYTGVFFFPLQEQEVRVFVRENQLFLQPEGNPAFLLEPKGKDIFYLPQIQAELQFMVETGGQVNEILAIRPGESPISMPRIPDDQLEGNSVSNWRQFCGRYRSSELESELNIQLEDDQLVVYSFHHP